MDLKEQLIKRFNEVIEKYDLSENKLSDIIHLARSSISSIRNNDKLYGKIANFYLLAEQFDISLDYIMRETENPYSHHCAFNRDLPICETVSQAISFIKDNFDSISVTTPNLQNLNIKELSVPRLFIRNELLFSPQTLDNSETSNILFLYEPPKSKPSYAKIEDAKFDKLEIELLRKLVKRMDEIIKQNHISEVSIISDLETTLESISRIRENENGFPKINSIIAYYNLATKYDLSLDYIAGRTNNKNAFKAITKRDNEVETLLYALYILARITDVSEISADNRYVVQYFDLISGIKWNKIKEIEDTKKELEIDPEKDIDIKTTETNISIDFFTKARDVMAMYKEYSILNGKLLNPEEYNAQMLLYQKRDTLIKRYTHYGFFDGRTLDVNDKRRLPYNDKTTSMKEIVRDRELELLNEFYNRVDDEGNYIRVSDNINDLSILQSKEEIDELEEYVNNMIEDCIY